MFMEINKQTAHTNNNSYNLTVTEKWRCDYANLLTSNTESKGFSLELIPRQINPFNSFKPYSLTLILILYYATLCVSKGVCTRRVFRLKFHVQFLTPKCVLHAQPNSFPSFEEPSRIWRTINLMVSLGTISSLAVVWDFLPQVQTLRSAICKHNLQNIRSPSSKLPNFTQQTIQQEAKLQSRYLAYTYIYMQDRVLMAKLEGKKHLGDPGVDGRIILRWILRE